MSPTAEVHQMASIGRLLAGIVHEINTPLGSIFSNNDVLCRSLKMLQPLIARGTPEDLERAGRIIETMRQLVSIDQIACERVRSIIKGLKTIARVDSPEPPNVDINELLRDTLKLTQAEFRKRITVETDFGELPEIECYPQMLGQVFLNLLVNAGQAIDGPGTIGVRTALERDGAAESVHVSIADTGRGMTPEQQAKAFQAGFTTKAVGEGTGLGLSIAKEIVEEKHGGTIDFESTPGRGTKFHVRIPVRHSRSQS
jgi:two-component system, NtrC family, sensor kinase